MVSFWPFRSGDSSSAGFEKILSSLSQKINKASAKDARLRSQQRRLRVLWTLYTSFAYLAALLILILVVGRRNWTATEYTSLALSPVGIYGVRLLIDTIFNYRLAGTQAQLDDLQKQRAAAIDKLKAATKYDTTQQLLDKYGGEKKKPAPQPKPEKKQRDSPRPARTGIPPPPTANITPQRPPPAPAAPAPPRSIEMADASFAPNAFEPAPVSVPAVPQEPKWYDRILDAIMGDDETSPRNRVVLLCGTCRLVNGQAPPGARTAEQIGRWRCMGCGTMNGEMGPVEAAGLTEKKAAPAEEDVTQEMSEADVMEDVRMEGEARSTGLGEGAARRRGA